MQARGVSGRKELKSVAAKLLRCQPWGALDLSSLASFAGSVDRSFGCRRLNCRSRTRHIVNVQFVFRTYLAFATLWALRNPLRWEDSLRVHVLAHLRGV